MKNADENADAVHLRINYSQSSNTERDTGSGRIEGES